MAILSSVGDGHDETAVMITMCCGESRQWDDETAASWCGERLREKFTTFKKWPKVVLCSTQYSTSTVGTNSFKEQSFGRHQHFWRETHFKSWHYGWRHDWTWPGSLVQWLIGTTELGRMAQLLLASVLWVAMVYNDLSNGWVDCPDGSVLRAHSVFSTTQVPEAVAVEPQRFRGFCSPVL